MCECVEREFWGNILSPPPPENGWHWKKVGNEVVFLGDAISFLKQGLPLQAVKSGHVGRKNGYCLLRTEEKDEA